MDIAPERKRAKLGAWARHAGGRARPAQGRARILEKARGKGKRSSPKAWPAGGIDGHAPSGKRAAGHVANLDARRTFALHGLLYSRPFPPARVK